MRTILLGFICVSLACVCSGPTGLTADTAGDVPTDQPAPGVAVSAAPAAAAEAILPLQATAAYVEEIVTKWSEVTFAEVLVEDGSLPAQSEETTVEGQCGLVAATYRVVYQNGTEVARHFLGEELVRAPVDRVVRKAPGPAGPSRGLPLGARSCTMLATAYIPYGPDTNGVTATGQRARRGIVAVDPRIIPLGTRLYVAGYGYAVAGDTGGAIKGNRIDLCMESAAEADRFGRREVRVFVLP